MTPDLIDLAVKAYQSGESAHSVARRFGVTFHNIRYHARKAGVWRPGKAIVPFEKRFWIKVNKTESCWIWMGAKFPNGYGCFSINRQSLGAHRVSFEISNGPIPISLVIDHLCRNRLCVNPAHLEVVTMPENVRRGMILKGKKYTLKS